MGDAPAARAVQRVLPRRLVRPAIALGQSSVFFPSEQARDGKLSPGSRLFSPRLLRVSRPRSSLAARVDARPSPPRHRPTQQRSHAKRPPQRYGIERVRGEPAPVRHDDLREPLAVRASGRARRLRGYRRRGRARRRRSRRLRLGRRGGAAGGGRGGAHERRASPPVDSMLRHRRESERDD